MDGARGAAARFAKAPAGHSAFIVETKGVSATRGGRPAAPPHPMEDLRLVVSRSAALPPVPLPGLRNI
ncbi:MAG: hypothetical protein NTV04_06120 [Deltaproteobacteria bacterium]|nr:hypothetical protein [Deltaproteobacteria bacterium]